MKWSLFFFFLYGPFFVVEAQQRIHPTLPSDFIRDIHFINEDEIIFINEGGTIYKTYDGGNTWEQKKDYLYTLDKIHFLNEKIGFVKPERNPEILYTTDGGESWENHPLSIYFLDNFLPISESKILKSNSEGQIELNDSFFNDWETVYEPSTFVDSSNYLEPIQYYGSVQQFEKAGQNHILALYPLTNAFEYGVISDSLNLIVKSDNKGLVWDTLFFGLNEFLYGIQFQDSINGWAYSENSFFNTKNGGTSWEKKYANPNAGITSFSVPDSNTVFGLIWEQEQQLIKTSDLGENWSNSSLPTGTFSNGRYNINFYDKDIGFLYGHHFYKTNNAGETWDSLVHEPVQNVYSLSFWNLSKGLAMTSGGVFHTENGGKSWNFLFTPKDLISNSPGEVAMKNDDEGWIVTNKEVYQTVAGINEFKVHPITSGDERYTGIAFKNNIGLLHSVNQRRNEGINIFDFSHHYLTTDGGENWSKIAKDDSSNSINPFEKVQITDQNHFWGMNRDGLWLSNDSAKTWNRIFNEDGFQYTRCFDFLNSEIGIVSTNNAVYFTKNGGANWIKMSRSSRPKDCSLIDKNIFNRYRYYEVNEDSRYFRMTFYEDGYVDLLRFMSTGTNQAFQTMEKLQIGNQPHIWAAGNGFTVFYDDIEITKTSNESNPELPNSVLLHQNYPNPFNPSTTIPFELDKPSKIKLIIFDALGRTVSVIIDEQKSAGTHQVTFDASNLSSGIYFYQLQSEDFVQTKKLILMK